MQIKRIITGYGLIQWVVLLSGVLLWVPFSSAGTMADTDSIEMKCMNQSSSDGTPIIQDLSISISSAFVNVSGDLGSQRNLSDIKVEVWAAWGSSCLSSGYQLGETSIGDIVALQPYALNISSRHTGLPTDRYYIYVYIYSGTTYLRCYRTDITWWLGEDVGNDYHSGSINGGGCFLDSSVFGPH